MKKIFDTTCSDFSEDSQIEIMKKQNDTNSQINHKTMADYRMTMSDYRMTMSDYRMTMKNKLILNHNNMKYSKFFKQYLTFLLLSFICIKK